MVLLLIIAAIAACSVIAIVAGAQRWQMKTQQLLSRLEAARLATPHVTYDASQISDLPPPVRRYFETVLTDGQSVVTGVRLTHQGQFNLGERKAQWKPFTSTQRVITQRPGFDWNGRIHLAPGIHVFVHDSYVGGEGLLHASLLGLATLADMHGTAEMARGELMRFLAEAAWYPTALLPSHNVKWEAIDTSSARVTLTDREVSVSLEFHFDELGLIGSVYSSARDRVVQGELMATPWEGRFWNYQRREGMLVPTEGEVAWRPAQAHWPYWRARLSEIEYEFAE